MTNRRVVVSFSGGKTSAFMAHWCLENWSRDHELLFLFANTGQEHERTLAFVDRCDREWGLGLVWVEADVRHGERMSSQHRIVDFATASRAGEPFEEVIRKYGIPNKAYPHCTRELKLNPMNAYLRSIGWEDRLTAIGIRCDELDRMQASAKAKGIVYPLVKNVPMDRAAIDRWWDAQPFTLEIPPLLGNCVWCWKKSDRKLLTIAQEHPEAFEFPARMEATYGLSGYNEDGTHRTFFRDHETADGIIARSQQPFRSWHEVRNQDLFGPEDMPNGCSDHCEVEL